LPRAVLGFKKSLLSTIILCVSVIPLQHKTVLFAIFCQAGMTSRPKMAVGILKTRWCNAASWVEPRFCNLLISSPNWYALPLLSVTICLTAQMYRHPVKCLFHEHNKWTCHSTRKALITNFLKSVCLTQGNRTQAPVLEQIISELIKVFYCVVIDLIYNIHFKSNFYCLKVYAQLPDMKSFRTFCLRPNIQQLRKLSILAIGFVSINWN